MNWSLFEGANIRMWYALPVMLRIHKTHILSSKPGNAMYLLNNPMVLVSCCIS